jgi:hypothetical protein
MTSRIASAVAAGLVLLAACSDRPPTFSTAPPADSSGVSTAAPLNAAGPRPDRLAFLLGRALADPDFRAYLKSQLDASPFPEHKLQLQAFLSASGRRAMRALATQNGIDEADVEREAGAAIPLEIYLPVPAHRAAWTGDDHVLVATALADRDAPVAFDPQGRRTVLSADAPPETPVIAVVPVETDFRTPTAQVQCLLDCGVDGGGSSGSSGSTAPGLYMTKAHFDDDYEGWLKGNPEYEIHMLGQAASGGEDLADYQCAGEHAGGPYTFDQNSKDWSGTVLLFSQNQIDAYKAAHPGQGLRVFALEDDDTACSIKTDPSRMERLLEQVDSAYQLVTGGSDSTASLAKYWHYAKAGYNIFKALASWITTDDDLIGNAVEDDIVGAFYPGFNWIIKGENNITHGWVNLEMR